jgi:hypothetical protein
MILFLFTLEIQLTYKVYDEGREDCMMLFIC